MGWYGLGSDDFRIRIILKATFKLVYFLTGLFMSKDICEIFVGTFPIISSCLVNQQI